jgi:aconitase B
VWVAQPKVQLVALIGLKKTIARRIQAMQKWLDAPELLTADNNAEYAATIEINLDDIKEPILACPNDPVLSKRLKSLIHTFFFKLRFIHAGWRRNPKFSW